MSLVSLYARRGVVLSSLLAAWPAFSQPAPRLKSTKVASDSPYAVVLRGGTGLGIFQDIQVPANATAQMRGDGKLGAEENADHAGMPIFAGLGLTRQSDNLTIEMIRFDALQMRAMTGPADTQSSSYSRIELGSSATYLIPLSSEWTLDLGVKAGVRRSSFSNVSSSHYIQSIMTGGAVGLGTADLRFEAFAAAAPVAKFGYSEDTFLGGKTFAKSKAALFEAGLTASFRIAPRVFIDTGVAQEAAHVTIDDISEYNDFGLSVEDPRSPARTYDLATTIAKFGLRKEF